MIDFARYCRGLAVILGGITLVGAAALLLLDLFPRLTPSGSAISTLHNGLAAACLTLIAAALLLFEVSRRPSRSEFVKAILLASAFLFWAANQLWPASRWATPFNDAAIALFVFDVCLVIASRSDSATER